MTCDFQQCGTLTSIDLDKPVQPPFKLRNCKCCSVSSFKGDISKFFIFHCKFLLYVGFYVFIKNPDHFPQCSVIK